MPAKPKQDSPNSSNDPSKRKPKPFEPRTTQSGTKTAKKSPAKPAVTSMASRGKGSRKPNRSGEGIPEAVSRRMIRRIALFCGIPTVLGMSTFVGSYLAVSNGLELPTYLVLLVSVGWFGLGVLGVSYGVLSASWDEEMVGSPLGLAEFKTNWGRMTETWRSNNQREK